MQPFQLDNDEFVSSLNGLTGAVVLAAGANITLTPVGSTITIATTGGNQTLAQTLGFGNVTGGHDLLIGDSDRLGLFDTANAAYAYIDYYDNNLQVRTTSPGASIAYLDFSSLTADRSIGFQNASGTLAFLSDIPTVSGTATQVAYFTGSNTINSSAQFKYDVTNNFISLLSGSNYNSALGFGASSIYSSVGSLKSGAGFYMGTGVVTDGSANNSLIKTSGIGDNAHFFYTRYDKGLEFHTGIVAAQGVQIADTTNLRWSIPDAGNFLAGVDNTFTIGDATHRVSNIFTSALQIGKAGTTTGEINLSGSTSGTVKLKTNNTAGTWTMELPATPGTNTYLLQTNGSGVTSWVAPSTATIGGSIAINQVAVGSGTNTIAGSAGLTFDGTTFDIHPQSIIFPDNYIYRITANYGGIGDILYFYMLSSGSFNFRNFASQSVMEYNPFSDYVTYGKAIHTPSIQNAGALLTNNIGGPNWGNNLNIDSNPTFVASVFGNYTGYTGYAWQIAYAIPAGSGSYIAQWNNGGGYLIKFETDGAISLGGATRGGWLTLPAGTATTLTAPIKFTSGTNLTAAEAGAMEWNGTNLFITQTTGPTRKTLAYTSDLGAYLPLVGGTMVGNILFTDNTYDIGASGTTRPRTGYFGTSVITNGFNAGYVAKTSTYTATVTDYTIDCTSGTFTVNLPTAVGITGRIYVIKNTGTGVITIDGNGAETIDGALTQTISVQYNSYMVQSTGANWIII